jgi:hypothetical protein
VRGVPATVGNPTATNRATLCGVCHQNYYGTADNHGANSAFTSGTDGGMTSYVNNGCNACHSSFYGTAATAVRPLRGIDVHGVNAIPTTGAQVKTARWLTDTKPYAFIRNTTTLSSHQPKVAGATTYTSAACATNNTAPSVRYSACGNGMGNYSAGGTY